MLKNTYQAAGGNDQTDDPLDVSADQHDKLSSRAEEERPKSQTKIKVSSERKLHRKSNDRNNQIVFL